MKTLLLFVLRAYQLCLGPLFGPNKCRFFPTCSNYAVEAVQKHGAAKGGMLAAKRICKCHPWHAGGYDPVPSDISDSSDSSLTPAADRHGRSAS